MWGGSEVAFILQYNIKINFTVFHPRLVLRRNFISSCSPWRSEEVPPEGIVSLKGGVYLPAEGTWAQAGW